MRFEPGTALGYKVIAGNLPFREYRSEVTLTARRETAGRRSAGVSTYRPKWPGSGGLIARRFEPFLQETAEKLARAAEQQQ